MPRIYISYRDKDTRRPIGGGDPLDFCRECWPVDLDELRFDCKSDVHGYDDSEVQEDIDDAGHDGHQHPPYAECEYDCAICGDRLTEEDD